MHFMCLALLSRVCFTDPSLLFVKGKKRKGQWRGKEKNNNVNRYMTQFDKEIIILHFWLCSPSPPLFFSMQRLQALVVYIR